MSAEEEALMTEYYSEMYNMLIEFAFTYLRDYSLAEDAVQDTFRVAWFRRKEMLASENPKGWLVLTLEYLLCNHTKHRRIMQRLYGDLENLTRLFPAFTVDAIDVNILYGDLAKTDEFRMVQDMVLYGKTYAELARERQISETTCRKQMQRAREKLRKKIKR